MKKYCYFNTNESHWFDVAKKLYEDQVAEPVFWLGADNHYDKASKLFGKNVVKSQSFIHRPYEFKNVNYNGENNNFFFSKNYLRAKDRCLKMMDRLDLYGSYSRQDREVVFNKIAIFLLKKLSKQQPDALVMAEIAHSHAQYLVLEVCLFLNIEIVKFNTWILGPLLYLENLYLNQSYI